MQAQQRDKTRFWSAFNWPIDVGNSFKFEHLDRLSSKSAFNLPRDVDNSFISTRNSCKLEHPNRLNFKNAFNLPIDVDNSFIIIDIDILRPWLKISKENCKRSHFVKWNTYK